MIDRDVVVDRVNRLLESLQGRPDIQGAAVLERAAQSLGATEDSAEIALHCNALARALRGIEKQGKLSEEEFAIARELHEEIDNA